MLSIRRIPTKGVLFCLVVLFSGLSSRSEAASIDGDWQGALQLGSTSIRVVFHFTQTNDGTITGKLESPDQGAISFAFDTVTFDGTSVRAEVKPISGVFEGKLNEIDKKIAGTWSQGSQSVPLTVVPMAAGAVVSKPKRPQEPVKPYPYDEEEVSYESVPATVRITGTLTKPRTKPPYKAVLLIAGSGPSDRNGEVMGHKPLLVLSDYLTRRGIAVLRVDKRGVKASTGNFATATQDDLAQDVLAGVAYLKSRKDIDAKHIGLIGHSEGGVVAPLAAVQSQDVAFIVLMAGPAQALAQSLGGQFDRMVAAGNYSPQIREQLFALHRRMVAAAEQETDLQRLQSQLESVWQEQKLSLDKLTLSAQEEQQLRGHDATVAMQIKALARPSMRYDPAVTLRRVTCPVLAINGSLDWHVAAKDNLPIIQNALKVAQNKDYAVIELPGLNHLFQAAKTGQPTEYAAIEETISPNALTTIGDWVVLHSTNARGK
jgi:pimeloyl-ACP methyl ester carboxylesterase